MKKTVIVSDDGEDFAEEFETFYQSAKLAPMLQFEINFFVHREIS